MSCNAFDAKLRQVYALTDVIHGIEDQNQAMAVCAILAKPWFSATDRQTLWTTLQGLWSGISGVSWP